jgi:hypothetical protein
MLLSAAASEDIYADCGIGEVDPCEDPGRPNPGGSDIRLSTAFWPDEDADMLCEEHSPPGLR